MFNFLFLLLIFVYQFNCYNTFPLSDSSEAIHINETESEINLLNATEYTFTMSDNTTINGVINDNISDPIIQNEVLQQNFTENIFSSASTAPSENSSDGNNSNTTTLNITTTTLVSLLPKNSSNNSASVLSIKCLPNQELKSCGSSCPPTCGIQEPKCESNCIKDICQCKKGFVAHQNGTCIHPVDCPKASSVKQCPPNSHLSPCGSLCPPTCLLPNPTICSLQCIVDDCVCDSGFVLDENHQCIKLEECPKMKKICEQNETFHECGTKCEGTCEEPFPAFCSDECLKNVCQCSEGFVRNDVEKCVLISKCL